MWDTSLTLTRVGAGAEIDVVERHLSGIQTKFFLTGYGFLDRLTVNLMFIGQSVVKFNKLGHALDGGADCAAVDTSGNGGDNLRRIKGKVLSARCTVIIA